MTNAPYPSFALRMTRALGLGALGILALLLTTCAVTTSYVPGDPAPTFVLKDGDLMLHSNGRTLPLLRNRSDRLGETTGTGANFEPAFLCSKRALNFANKAGRAFKEARDLEVYGTVALLAGIIPGIGVSVALRLKQDEGLALVVDAINAHADDPACQAEVEDAP